MNPEKPRLRAAPPSGRIPGEWARIVAIPPTRPRFSEIAAYLGRKGGVSHRAILRATVQKYLQVILIELDCSLIRRPAGFSANDRDSGGILPGLPKIIAVATYLGRQGGISTPSILSQTASKYLLEIASKNS